jgi:hypothetical protein
MKNIIVVGDSFCSDVSTWPGFLAQHLGLNLICQGVPGGHWWHNRDFLLKLSAEVLNQTDIMVFVHTNAHRIPTLDQNLGKLNTDGSGKSELEQAVYLYNKYINDVMYAEWAQRAWFKEIAEVWGHKKLCHLQAFPWSADYQNLLSGLVILPNLTALSLNELGSENFTLMNDTRSNHFNTHNNQILAQELAQLISGNSQGVQQLNLGRFEQRTQRWLGWR